MFKRVMVAVVGLPLLILILGWAPSWATMLLLAAMCAIGAWELMRAAAGERGKPLTPLTVIAAAAVPVCVYGEMSIENTELTALPVLPFAALLGAVFIFAIFALAIHRYDEEQGIPFKAIHITDKEAAQGVPAPVTTYALFRDGEFLTQGIQSDKKFLALAGIKG